MQSVGINVNKSETFSSKLKREWNHSCGIERERERARERERIDENEVEGGKNTNFLNETDCKEL